MNNLIRYPQKEKDSHRRFFIFFAGKFNPADFRDLVSCLRYNHPRQQKRSRTAWNKSGSRRSAAPPKSW